MKSGSTAEFAPPGVGFTGVRRGSIQARSRPHAPVVAVLGLILRYYFDGKATSPGNPALLSGSANFTVTDTHVNVNHVFVFHNSFVCRQYEVEFN